MKLFVSEAIDRVHTFFAAYPKIEGEAAQCSYYRKQNRSIPIAYFVFALCSTLVALSHPLFLLFTDDPEYTSYSFSRFPFQLANVLLIFFASIYCLKLKTQAEAKERRDDLAFQRHVRRRLQLFAGLLFLACSVYCAFGLSYGGNKAPVSLLWINTFMTILYSSMWFLEGLTLKILQVAAFNVFFCVLSKDCAGFSGSMLERILLPVIMGSIYVVSHDNSTKATFLLKRRLKEQKSVYEVFLHKFQDPTLILDRDQVLFTNPSAGELMGETVGQFYNQAAYIVSQKGYSLEAAIKGRLETRGISKEPIMQEKYFMHDAGSETIVPNKTLLVTIIESEFFSRGKTIALILRDITSELIHEYKKMEDRFKNMMLYSLSHELRTPLNILQSALHLGKRPDMSKEARECYEGGKGAWNYLRNKINDTLTYAQILTGEFILHECRFSLDKFVGYLNKVTTFLLRGKKSCIALQFHKDTDVEDVFMGDRERLEQILFNLLQNAVKYTEAGTIFLKIRRISPIRLVFEVSDTGCGFSDQILSSLALNQQHFGTTTADMINLMESSAVSFVRNSTGRTSCGLGLTVSQMICQKMDTFLTVSSALGKGSKISFEVPLIRHDVVRETLTDLEIAEEDSVVNPCVQGHGVVLGTIPDLTVQMLHAWKDHKKKEIWVLVVDDNEFNRLVAKRMVGKYGFHVSEAENGLTAVEKSADLRKSLGPDDVLLVLMDLDMPVMNGIDATKLIRGGDKTPQNLAVDHRVFVCALTAFASEAERNGCFAAGMNWFVSKPLTKENLNMLLTNMHIISQ